MFPQQLPSPTHPKASRKDHACLLALTQFFQPVQMSRHHWVTATAACCSLGRRETQYIMAAKITLWMWMHAPAPTQLILTNPLSIQRSSFCTSPALSHVDFLGSLVPHISVLPGADASSHVLASFPCKMKKQERVKIVNLMLYYQHYH